VVLCCQLGLNHSDVQIALLISVGVFTAHSLEQIQVFLARGRLYIFFKGYCFTPRRFKYDLQLCQLFLFSSLVALCSNNILLIFHVVSGRYRPSSAHQTFSAWRMFSATEVSLLAVFYQDKIDWHLKNSSLSIYSFFFLFFSNINVCV